MVVLISFPAPPWNRRNEHRNKCSYKLTSPTDWILPIPSCITTFPYCNHCRRTELFIKIVFIFHQTVIKFHSFSNTTRYTPSSFAPDDDGAAAATRGSQADRQQYLKRASQTHNQKSLGAGGGRGEEFVQGHTTVYSNQMLLLDG